MAKAIPISARGEAQQTVEFKHTLTSHHPELPPVYSTPDMIRLMETAAFHALHSYCEGDEITVGTAINVEHRTASGIGAHIKAEAVLESFDGRFYTLRVTARDDVHEIGRGTVGRTVVSMRKFVDKMKSGTRQLDPRQMNRAHTKVDPAKKAEFFRSLHSGDNILLLPNAWDVASARIVEEAGFEAIATTSAGIAFSLGYPDGQKISRDKMLAAVARIAGAVNVPVTADVEAGYGNSPEDAAQTAMAVIEAGAIGMNLEDASGNSDHPLVDLQLQLEKIRAIREASTNAGVPLVINARTDVYLLQVGDESTRYDEALRRLRAFRDAGADCVFLPGVRDAPTIGRLAADVKCPLNILAGPGSPSVADLQRLGVSRISLGSGPARAALGRLRRIVDELRTTGTYTAMEDAPTHAELNRILQQNQK